MRHVELAVGLALLALSCTAGAADSVATVDDLARVQAETLMLRAKAKAEDARAELAVKRAQGAQLGAIDDRTTLPVVKTILGTDRLVATFLYPNNVSVPASIGDTLPGGYVVASIDGATNKVEIARGKERYVIGFSTSAPVPRDRQPAPGSTAPTPFVVPAPIGVR
jgi:type IV pilus biogenesis protein PilP